MTKTDGAPWAVVGDWNVPGLLPGHLAQLRRMEAVEAAQERREADERTARAEDRRDRWTHTRMQEYLYRGIDFDPADLRTLIKSREQLATEVFTAQDAEAARDERRALVEVGLLHVLGSRPDELTSPPSDTPDSATGPSAGAASRATVGSKIRAAMHRWARPRASCSCAACDPTAVTRTEVDEPSYIIRSTRQYER